MLPGLDGTGAVFGPCLEQLPSTIVPKVVSYPAGKPLSFAEHVAVARQQLPKREPFVLLAESFSGPVGLQLLADPPPNLKGAIFVATFARYPQPMLLDLGRHLPQGPLLKLFATTPALRWFCLGRAPAAAVAIFRAALKQVALKVLTRRLEILAELPPPPAIDRTIPCLYLQASRDRLVPARALDYFQDQFENLEVARINGPHITLLAHPAAGAKAIGDFIHRLVAGEQALD